MPMRLLGFLGLGYILERKLTRLYTSSLRPVCLHGLLPCVPAAAVLAAGEALAPRSGGPSASAPRSRRKRPGCSKKVICSKSMFRQST